MDGTELMRFISDTNKLFSNKVQLGEIEFADQNEKDAAQLEFFLIRFSDVVIEECANECSALDELLTAEENRTATGAECAEMLRSNKQYEDIYETQESEDDE